MPKRTHAWMSKFRREARHVCLILTGYSELEFAAYTCAASIVGDNDTTFRMLFRTRSESQRIQVIDAILYPKMLAHGLQGHYSHAITSLRQCRAIRNTYAHCHWDWSEGILTYCNIEQAAKSSDGEAIMAFHHLTLLKLCSEVKYFAYCEQWFDYLDAEIDVRSGKTTSHDLVAPKPRPKPSL